MDKNVFPVAGLVAGQLVPQCRGSDAPSGNAFEAFPSAAATAFKVHAAAERGTDVAVREYRLATFWAFELKQLRMLQGAAHKGAKPHRIWSNLGHPAAAVGHLEVEGDEIEPVFVFPLVEAGVDFRRVPVEELGVAQLLPGRHFSVRLEEIVLLHGTDFF